MGPELLEPEDRASVGEDVEKSQEFTVDSTGGAHHTGKEVVGDAPPRGVGLPVAEHLSPLGGLEELVWLGTL